MDKVKAMIAAGASIPTAIKESLGMPLRVLAEKHGIAAPVMSDVINGNRRATDAHLDALISELGGTRYEWRRLLWEAAKPVDEPAAERVRATA